MLVDSFDGIGERYKIDQIFDNIYKYVIFAHLDKTISFDPHERKLYFFIFKFEALPIVKCCYVLFWIGGDRSLQQNS